MCFFSAGWLSKSGLLGGKFLDRNVLELDRRPMSAKANMSAPALGSLVLRLQLVDFVQVGIQNNDPVQFHYNARAIDRDLLMVPLTGRFEMTPLGRLQFVKGAMILGIDKFGILGMLIVEDLQFHSRGGGTASARVVNPQPVISSRRQQKIKLEDVISVLLFRDEVAPLADEDTVLDNVFGVFPTRKVLTIKERDSFLALGKTY